MKIGDLANQVGMTAKTIRFYEEAGLLPEPPRTSGGYRDYGPAMVDRLRFIRRGQAAGLSLQQVRQVLAISDRGDAPCTHVRQVLSGRLDEVRVQIAELVTLETYLESLLAHAHEGAPTEHDTSSVCWILETAPEVDAAVPAGDR
jgi:DNA-binding transcriptional MerR regulator